MSKSNDIMKLEEVMNALEEMGNERTKNTFLKHGAKEPFFGVRVGDMKKLVKKIKKDHELSLSLYDTGNGDAMYMAGLIADEEQISKGQLQHWADKANWYMLSEYTVAWIAAESNYGWELGLEWIDSDKEHVASSGWSTLSNYISITDNSLLDKEVIEQLLHRVEVEIKDAPNRVRYTMNGFVIAVGSYMPSLTVMAKTVAKKNGKISVNLGSTACKVPFAPDYIEKIEKMGRIGKKRKMARC